MPLWDMMMDQNLSTIITHKILTSQNFCFLTLAEKVTPPEQIVVAPNLPLEGENEGSTLLMGSNQNLKQKQSDNSKRKQDESEEDEVDTPLCKTCRKRVDYRHLNDPPSPTETRSSRRRRMMSLKRPTLLLPNPVQEETNPRA